MTLVNLFRNQTKEESTLQIEQDPNSEIANDLDKENQKRGYAYYPSSVVTFAIGGIDRIIISTVKINWLETEDSMSNDKYYIEL